MSSPTSGIEVATDAVARARKAGADEARAVHTSSEKFEVNFDTDDVTLVRSTVTDSMGITVYVGTRRGSTELTGRAHDAVERAVEEAIDAARAAAPDPAAVLPDGPVPPAVGSGEVEADEEAMIDAVLRHVAQVRQEYPDIRTDSSSYSLVRTRRTYADSNDRVQHAVDSTYELMLLVAGKNETASTSFNYTALASREPVPDITGALPVRRLLDTTVATFDARPVPATFVGDVIFTPEALSVLLYAVVGALDGSSLFRGTTPYADRLGTTVASSELRVLNRPGELEVTPPFDGFGFPSSDFDIIGDGVLETFLVDWYYSRKLDRPMTPPVTGLMVAPGTTPLEEIIAGTERGLLLGRFSGGSPSPTLDFSGVAKNSFYVEDGEVKHPVSETMVAGNFADAITSIRAVSQDTVDFGPSRHPWLAVGGVTISTK